MFEKKEINKLKIHFFFIRFFFKLVLDRKYLFFFKENI